MSIAVCNPTDGSTITADLQVAGGEDINAVVAAATSAFRTGPWDYAGHADKIAGEPYPPEDGIYKIVTYEPLGVCAFLASFKATFLYVGLKLRPALAAGNTASEKSPLGALALGRLVCEAGFPLGSSVWSLVVLRREHYLLPTWTSPISTSQALWPLVAGSKNLLAKATSRTAFWN
ncbi:hypothetical protein KXV44_008905 [Aspergillus fumigatus]|nr:hypothetical protein KXX39_005562 [Aspergillus fumigatus]KAH2183632.1 hypothetical protein KXW61_002177 [Aspergillus fumigatus]KAH2418209.1 hypothetical protein KXV44_008905 [Aspergillus fumigatus]KAH2455156.1 hypothetical protein KXW63_003990 [Aspergillus fumigatus]KAH2989273.1 hypothetical protein KXV25_009372 [Aspergillus fumigatus]